MHVSRPIAFTLGVDDFGIKYEGQEHLDHLLSTLNDDYTIEVDREGKLYCGISLEWNYENNYVNRSMPSYVKKNLPNMPIPPQPAGDTPPTIQHQ